MADCKQQILSTIPDNNACSHAFFAILLQSNPPTTKNKIILSSRNDILDKACNIISNFYPSVVTEKLDNSLVLSGDLSAIIQDSEIKNFKDSAARLTLLKSIFLFYGNFYYNQDNMRNSKGYNLEFVLKNELNTITNELLNEFGFELKSTIRQKNCVIYTKNSNIICDLLVLLGATKTALEIQNSLAMREMRNSANRQNNCFEYNLDKTLDASREQLTAINYLMSNGLFDNLDENLKDIALARLANPDVSYQDLRTIMNDSISRAGIKYRLDKIIKIYKTHMGETK